MSGTRPLRVLLLAQFYPPVIGGEEQHVRALAQSLSRRGHRVTVATLRQPGLTDSAWDGEVRVERLPGTIQRIEGLYQSPKRLAAPVPDPETAVALRGVLARERPDVVHAHNWLVYSYLPFARNSRPLLLTLHDYGQVCAKKTLIYEDAICSGPAPMKCLRCASGHYGTGKGIATVAGSWAMSAAARQAVDLFLPVSTAVAEGNHLAADGLPHEVIPNFIPDTVHEAVDDAALPERLPADGFILFVGAFARRKGVEVLLDAYTKIPSAPPLVLIGYRSSDVIPALDDPPGDVHVFSDWPAPAVAEAWRRASFGIVPSTWADPCPTVVIEAMAAGRPVIASRAGGIVDLVVNETTGLLVPPGDPEALAGAMRRLLSDRGRCREMGAAGQKRSADYRASTVVTRIEDAYYRLLEQRQPRAMSSTGAP